MQKTKTKNTPPASNTSSDFRFIWTLSQAVLLIVLWVWMEIKTSFHRQGPSPFFDPKSFLIVIAIVFLTSIAAATLQQTTIERNLKHSMRGWARVTSLGAVLSIVAFALLERLGLFIEALALILPITCAQTLWLQRRSQSAWLWPLVNMIGGLLSVLPFREFETWTPARSVVSLVVGFLQALIQTVVITHLLTTETRKQKPL